MDNYELNKLKVKNIVAFILGILLLSLGPYLFLLPVLINSGVLHSSASSFINIIVANSSVITVQAEVVGIGLSILFFENELFYDMRQFRHKWGKYILIIIIGFGLLFLFSHLYDYIYSIVGVSPDSENQEIVYMSLTGNIKLLSIISVCIIAPIFEELVFRKFAYCYLKNTKMPLFMTVFIVAFMFAIIHCSGEDFATAQSWLYLSNYFILSLVITISYVYTDNIYVPIAIHMLNNIYSILLFYSALSILHV